MAKESINPEANDTTIVADGAVGIEEAERYCGMGRTWLYGEMGAGRLPYVTCGRRRLIPRRALQDMLARGLVGLK